MTLRGDDGVYAERGRRPQDRADIVRVCNLVEHEHERRLGQIIEVQRLQRLAEEKHPLMHGVRLELAADVVRAHDDRLERQRARLREAERAILGREQPGEGPARIGQSGPHGVEAVDDG